MKKILYAEDNVDIGNAVKHLLNCNDFKVKLTCSGKETLEATKEEEFDLFIVDSILVDMQGIDLVTKLKKQNSNSKYILIDTRPMAISQKEELKANGVDDFMQKPFLKCDLLEKVQNLLRDQSKSF